MIFETKTSSLSVDQLKVFTKHFGLTKTLLSAGVAKLHTKPNSDINFIYSGVFGALCFVLDRVTEKRSLQLINLNTLDIKFELEVKPTLSSSLYKLNDHFLYFYWKNSTVGFSFTDSNDIAQLEYILRNYSSKRQIATRSKRTKLTKPLSFEIVEDLRWDNFQETVDFQYCSQEIRALLNSKGINGKPFTQSVLMLDKLGKIATEKRESILSRQNKVAVKAQNELFHAKLKEQMEQRFNLLYKNSRRKPTDKSSEEDWGSHSDSDSS